MKRFFSVLLFLSIVVGCYSQNKVRGELRTEENGFQWYCYQGKEAYTKDGVRLFPGVKASNIKYDLRLKGVEQDIENGCFLVNLSRRGTVLWDGKSAKTEVCNLYTSYGKLIKEGVLCVQSRLSVGGYGTKDTKYYYTLIGASPLSTEGNLVRCTGLIINDDGVPIIQNVSNIKGILSYNEKPEKRICFWGTTKSGNTFIITDNGGSLELQGSYEVSFDDYIVYAQSEDRKIQKLYSKDWTYWGELEKSAGVFRLIKKDDYVGVVNKEGNWVIKQEYPKIDVLSSSDQIYFVVKRNENCGLFDTEGREMIPISRGYTSIDYDSGKGTFAITKPKYTGICDAQGNEISLTKLPPTAEDIKADGGYASAVELMNGNTKYYKVNKNGHYGLTSAEGKVIVPTEMEALESAGTGYLRYKLNGFWGVMNYAGRIIIPTDRGYTKVGDYVSFTKRFPYEMAGWKGECDINGRQISKIKVVESHQSPVSSSSVASFISEDLKAYDLRGKVKKCKWKGKYVDIDYLPILEINDEYLTEFSQDGKLQIENYDIIRDNSGRITQIKSTITPLSYELYYDAQGRLIEVRRAMPFLGSKVVDKFCYSYDSSNRIESIRAENNYSPDNNNEPWCRFEYVQSDSKGNWIKRIAKCGMLGNITQSRVIEYY